MLDNNEQPALTVAQLAFAKKPPKIYRQLWLDDSGRWLMPGMQEFQTINNQSDAFGFLDRQTETLPPHLIGLMVEMMTRVLVLNKDQPFEQMADTCFQNAYRGARLLQLEGLFDEQLTLLKLLLAKQAANGKFEKDTYLSLVNVFAVLGAFEQAYRGSQFKFPYGLVDWPTAKHLNIMVHRAAEFFNRVGRPTTIDFAVESADGCLYGDGDFLSPNSVIDFKTYSTDPTYEVANRRQMVLYYVLGHFADPAVYPEFKTVKQLVLFNPRSDRTFVWRVDERRMQKLADNVRKFGSKVVAKIWEQMEENQ